MPQPPRGAGHRFDGRFGSSVDPSPPPREVLIPKRLGRQIMGLRRLHHEMPAIEGILDIEAPLTQPMDHTQRIQPPGRLRQIRLPLTPDPQFS